MAAAFETHYRPGVTIALTGGCISVSHFPVAGERSEWHRYFRSKGPFFWLPQIRPIVMGQSAAGPQNPRIAGRLFILPLWIPFLLVAVPTGVLWWRDLRRTRPGHCRCGYNLTGNTSGMCPECGNRIGDLAAQSGEAA